VNNSLRRSEELAQLRLILGRHVRVDVFSVKDHAAAVGRLRGEVRSPGTSVCGTASLNRKTARRWCDRTRTQTPLGRRDDVDVASILAKRQELWRLRQIVVPEIVMHEPKVPQPLARACIERHQAVAEQVVPWWLPP
jgi:hypothetical protein